MTGGALFDLWALAFAATIGGIAGLIYFLRTKPHRTKLHDWATEWPEYGHSKDGHVKVVP